MIVSSPSIPSRDSKAKQGISSHNAVDTRSKASCSKQPRTGSTKHRKSDPDNSDYSQCTTSAPRAPSSTTSKSLSHVPCKFFKQGACQAGDKCPFSHYLEGSQSVDKIPCKFFQRGNCKFGQKCALAHILPNGQRVNSRRSASSNSTKSDHFKEDRRPLSFTVSDDRDSRPHSNRSHQSQPRILRRLSEPLSPFGAAEPNRRFRLPGLDMYTGMSDLAQANAYGIFTSSDRVLEGSTVSELALANGTGILSEFMQGPFHSPSMSLRDLHSYAWQLLATLLTLPLAVPLSQMLDCMSRHPSQCYSNFLGSAPSPPGRRESHIQSFLLPDGPDDTSSSMSFAENEKADDMRYDDVFDDVFIEDYIPESLSDIILTPQELMCRQSRSQLGTLSSQPTVSHSRQVSQHDVPAHFFAATHSPSHTNQLQFQSMDFAISPHRNHENVFVMD